MEEIITKDSSRDTMEEIITKDSSKDTMEEIITIENFVTKGFLRENYNKITKAGTL